MSVRMNPPKRLYIMQGIPGSGKSTLARILKESLVKSDLAPGGTWEAQIISTDEFWGPDYDFDPAMLGNAHSWNQRRCIAAMEKSVNFVFVDNTNIKKTAAAPYIAFANAFGYDYVVVRVDVDVEVAVARNKQRPIKRRVPEDVVRRMYADMEQLV